MHICFVLIRTGETQHKTNGTVFTLLLDMCSFYQHSDLLTSKEELWEKEKELWVALSFSVIIFIVKG